MNTRNYKREAHNFYRQNNLLEAYKCAWHLPFEDFVHWFTDAAGKRKRSKSISFFNNPFFYNSFLTAQPSNWLQNSDAALLWEYYLRSQKNICIEFELLVAHNSPSLFIEGYKDRLVFLNSSRLALLQEKQLPLSILNELKIWIRFNVLLNKKWNNVEVLFKNIKLLPYEIYMATFAAFESSIYKKPDDKLHWHYAVETLSLTTAFIQNKYNLSNIKVEGVDITKAYHNGVIQQKGESLFNEVYEYVYLKENLYRYAYEPSLEVFFDNKDDLCFQESNAFNKQWNHDEHRYAINELSYYDYGERLFNESEILKKINYVNNNKTPNNQLGNKRQFAIRQAIYDLGISDEDIKNKKLPSVNFMISFLHGIAWRKTETTEKPLHKIARVKRNEYVEGVLELIHRNKVSEFILVSDTNTLYNAAIGSGLNCTKQEFDQFISSFSFNWRSKEFDPLKQPLSLWKKPFIQIGKHIISPISVLTGFSGLYTISESILINFRPRDGRNIERILNDIYKNARWKTSLLKNNQDQGDVDLVMEDDENIIFIQLKRTAQKIGMFELRNQLPQDRKAIKQLIEAKSASTIKKNIHLWYVTTAFEKVGTWEKGVYRVSYQDLIHLNRLISSDGLRLDNLTDFIEFIESDKPYKINKEYFLN